MKIDSLDGLKKAFAEWRKEKKHAREAVPDELLARAQRAAKKHGVKAVVRVTRVERSRLFRGARVGRAAPSSPRRERRAASNASPSFSRLELHAPVPAETRPLVEVETAGGVKVRVFEGTPEMVELLSAVCGLGRGGSR